MKYTTEQITAIIDFVNDFATWVNQELDKETAKIAEIAFAVTPEYRAKVKGTTETYSKCLHHLADATKQLAAESFGELLK